MSPAVVTTTPLPEPVVGSCLPLAAWAASSRSGRATAGPRVDLLGEGGRRRDRGEGLRDRVVDVVLRQRRRAGDQCAPEQDGDEGHQRTRRIRNDPSGAHPAADRAGRWFRSSSRGLVCHAKPRGHTRRWSGWSTDGSGLGPVARPARGESTPSYVPGSSGGCPSAGPGSPTGSCPAASRSVRSSAITGPGSTRSGPAVGPRVAPPQGDVDAGSVAAWTSGAQQLVQHLHPRPDRHVARDHGPVDPAAARATSTRSC